MTIREHDDPWAILGLAPTADAADIRKAYAVKLKVTRPDDDPAGFQRLVEARDWALRASHGSDIGNHRRISTVEATAPAVSISVLEPAEPDDDIPETIKLLNALPRDETSPIGLLRQWSEVLDALERAPLALADQLKCAVLLRLVYAVAEYIGPMPERENLPKSASKNARLMGQYTAVLREIDRRLNLLDQDRTLFETLDWERARYLLKAIEYATGRYFAASPRRTNLLGMRVVDDIWVRSLFKNDPKVLECYLAVVAGEKPKSAFSIYALLLPLPVALYYRLYGYAAISGALIAWFAVARINWVFGGSESHVFPIFLYPLVVYVTSFMVPLLRIGALASKIASLAKTNNLRDINAGVEDWSKPNRIGMWVGIVLTVMAILSVVLI